MRQEKRRARSTQWYLFHRETMEHASDGVRLWYGDAKTIAPSGNVTVDGPVSVTVGVRPACLTNAVDVEYRINGGPRRILPSRLVKTDTQLDTQFFNAVFPY